MIAERFPPRRDRLGLVRRAFARRIDSDKFAFRAGRPPGIGRAPRPFGLEPPRARELAIPLASARAVLRMAAADGLTRAALARMLDVPEDAVRAAAEWLGERI
jgi:hypothetical protein